MLGGMLEPEQRRPRKIPVQSRAVDKALRLQQPGIAGRARTDKMYCSTSSSR